MTPAVRTICAATLLALCSPPLMAAPRWNAYGNARFNYRIDVPPGFSAVREAENGDGGVSTSADRDAVLRVWGGHLTGESLSGELAWRIDQDRREGWTVTYQTRGADWGAWSGLKGERIFYARAIRACDGAAAWLRLEYDRARAKALDPIISRLGKSLRRGSCRAPTNS